MAPVILNLLIAVIFLAVSPSVETKSLTEPHHVVKRQVAAIDDKCYKADIVFSLDSSGSIGQENWYKVLNFTRSIVAEFKIGPENIRVGMNYYGGNAHLQFHLNSYNTTEDMFTAIDAMPWLDQTTNTAAGIRMMYRDMFTPENGMRSGVPHIGIVMTDGASNREQNETIPQADEARLKGITMFAIGIGNATSQAELEGIADSPRKDYVFEATGFDALLAITEKVVAAACKAASECNENGDWLLLVDSSGSVGRANFELIRAFLRELIQDTNIDNGEAKVALMTFSDTSKVEWGLDRYNLRGDMQTALDAVIYRPGTTNTAGALKAAREQVFITSAGDRTGRHNVIVLFTDGNSNNLDSTLEEARRTRAAGIKILVVACSDWINMFELKEIASDPDDRNVINAINYSALSSIYQSIKRAVCNDNNECSNDPCQNGGTCFSSVNGYYCECFNQWAGKNCEIGCPDSADVIIVLDSSSSLGQDGYYEIQNYARELVRALQVAPNGGRRVGLLTFSGTADAKINLDLYTRSEALATAISYRHMTGITNMAGAIDRVMGSMFQAARGDRSSAANVIILLSDGNSADRAATIQAAARAHANGAVILTGTRRNNHYYRTRELMAVTSDPDADNFIQAVSFRQLSNYTSSFVRSVCNTVDDCSPNPCQGGSTCRNLINRYECVCPQGRSGIHCERTCDSAIDLVFIIDSSGSIRESRYQTVLSFVTNITEELDVATDKTRVAVVRFSNNAQVEFNLNAYSMKEDVINRVRTFRYDHAGTTHTADALAKLKTDIFVTANGDRITMPNIVIVITDGHSNVNEQMTIPNAIEARVSGAHMIVVSVESDVNNLELRAIASRPWRSNLYAVNKFSDLSTFVQQLVFSVCDDTNECLSNPCQNGGTCFDRLNLYQCSCTDSYTGVNCERPCTSQRDVVFVLDASGSVDLFYAAQLLTQRIIEGLNFAFGRTRVAVLTYQDVSQVRFHLNKYTTMEESVNAIAYDRNMHIHGTNTADALKDVGDNMLTALNGDRSGVQNIVISISDGHSNINSGRTLSEADALRGANVRVVAVGLGPNANVAEIAGIADNSASVAYMVTEADVDSAANLVLDAMCV